MVPADSGGIPRVPPYSGFRLMQDVLRVRGFHALWRRFPAPSASMTCNFVAALQPRRRRNAAGLLPFRSPLLGESFLFSPPAGTEMFQFPAFASRVRGMPALCRRVAPFGYPRIIGRLRLPADFRSLPRPSSPAGAKASTMRLFPLRMPAAPLRRRGPFVFLSCSNMSMTSPAATPRE